MSMMPGDKVETVNEFLMAPEEYRQAVEKIVISHAINELYGAQVFDEPAIALAPTPYSKWLTCRVAMEEYGHHVRFRDLGNEIGIPPERMVPSNTKKPLSIFEFPLETWEEFCVIKLLADLAEIIQVGAKKGTTYAQHWPGRFSKLKQDIKKGYSDKVKAELTSAKELSESEIKNIKDELSKNFSSKIKLNYKFDPSLIGGLIVQVGSTMVDTSIKNKLKKIENRMIEA